MAKPSGGLTKWFKKEKWVDISAPKKGGGFEKCGRSKAKGKGGSRSPKGGRARRHP